MSRQAQKKVVTIKFSRDHVKKGIPNASLPISEDSTKNSVVVADKDMKLLWPKPSKPGMEVALSSSRNTVQGSENTLELEKSHWFESRGMFGMFLT